MAKDRSTPKAPQNELPAQIEMQVLRTTILHQFRYQVHELPGGQGRQIDIILPTGEVIALPLVSQAAEDLGRRLVAPSVHVPPNGARALG